MEVDERGKRLVDEEEERVMSHDVILAPVHALVAVRVSVNGLLRMKRDSGKLEERNKQDGLTLTVNGKTRALNWE